MKKGNKWDARLRGHNGGENGVDDERKQIRFRINLRSKFCGQNRPEKIMNVFFTKLINSQERDVEAHLVLMSLGALALIGLSIFHVVFLRLPFNPTPFGEGLGYLLAGGGAAAWGQGLQRSNEKEKSNDNPQ